MDYDKKIEKDNELIYSFVNKFRYEPITLEIALEKYSNTNTEIIPIKEVITIAYLMFMTELDIDAYIIDNYYY